MKCYVGKDEMLLKKDKMLLKRMRCCTGMIKKEVYWIKFLLSGG